MLAILCCLLVCGISHAQTLDKARLDLLFDRLLDKHKGMGSITLTKDGKLLYTHSFGYAQITDAGNKPLTDNTRYRIASITKTYTAVMILQLVEEGKLKLTSPLGQFFPQIPNADKITIAQILQHRSGIPDMTVDPGWRAQAHTHEEIVAAIAKGKPLFEPDSQHLYSNTGYVLLGYILEKVEGKPYADILQRRINKKIGLQNTYLGIGNTDTSKQEALSYRYMGAWKEVPEMDLSIPAGAGAIIATPTDMCHFITALFEGKLLSKKSLDLMTTMRDGEGMGMEPFSFAGHTLYGHTGGSNVSGSWLAYEPTEKLALAYTTNAKIYPVKDIVAGVFDIYWNKPYQVPTFDAVAVSDELLNQYVGVYVIAGTPAKMTVTKNGSNLFIDNNGNAIPLEATSDTTFTLAPGVTVTFDTANKQMTIKRPQGERVFTKQP